MLIVMSISRAQAAAIQGLQRMRWFSLSEVLNKVTVTVAGAALLLAGFGVTTYALVMLCGALVALATGSLFIARQRFDLGRLHLTDLRPFLAREARARQSPVRPTPLVPLVPRRENGGSRAATPDPPFRSLSGSPTARAPGGMLLARAPDSVAFGVSLSCSLDIGSNRS